MPFCKLLIIKYQSKKDIENLNLRWKLPMDDRSTAFLALPHFNRGDQLMAVEESLKAIYVAIRIELDSDTPVKSFSQKFISTPCKLA